MAASRLLTVALAAGLWLGAATPSSAQPAAPRAAPAPGAAPAQPPPAAAAEAAAALARSAAAAAAAKAELAEQLRIHDAILTMRLLAGELTPEAAARELARIALEQAARPSYAEVPPETVAAHRQAAERLFTVIEQRARSDATWPRDRTAEDYRIFARVWLHRLRNDYNDALLTDGDAAMVLLEAEELLALTRGQADLDPTNGAFAGTDARIAAALASVEQSAAARRVARASAPPAATPPPATSTVARPPAAGSTAAVGPGPSGPAAPRGATTAAAAALTLTWLGKDADRVGQGAATRPDGRPDGHFRVSLTLPQQAELRSISLYQSDAQGNRVGGGHVWHTQDQSNSILGVFFQDRQVNPGGHTPTMDAYFQGRFDLDLYAADTGAFVPGRFFTVDLVMGDGRRLRHSAQVR